MQNNWKAHGVAEIKNILYVPMADPEFQENFFGLPFINTQLFDDLYFIGTKFVGCIVLKTDDGLVLFDAMNHESDGKKILKAIEDFGLNVADLKHLIITHGHVDHYGGAKYIKEQTKCTVYMSETDYTYMQNVIIGALDLPQGKENDPGIDRFLTEGEVLTIGNYQIHCYFTPGHTPGCMSFIFPVHDGEDVHHVALWGGTAAPVNLEASQAYFDSLTRFMDISRDQKVDVSFNAHPFFDYSLAKGIYEGKIAERKAGEPHPFVLGVERYQIFLQALRAFIVGHMEGLK